MAEHNVMTTANIHPLPGLGPYANEAARTGAAPAAADLYKAAYQTDTGALWCLVGYSPVRWQRAAGPMPVRTQSGTTYTTTIDDADAMVRTTSASAVTVTVPPNSSVPYAVGETILFTQDGAGLLTLAAGAGVTFTGTSFVSAGQNAVLSAFQKSLNNWVIGGKTT